MKKVFALLLLLMAFVSCEKPIISDDSNDKQGVKQNANLLVNIVNVGLSITRLNFVVFDMDGTRVKQVNQQSGAADFGLAEFQLEEGMYQLVVVAHSSDGNPTLANIRKVQYTNAQGFTDTFLGKSDVVIADEQVKKTVFLERIVSLCRFEITGDYPQNVAKMRFYYTGGSGAFDATTGLGCVKSKQSVLFDVTNGQNVFDLYTFLHASEGTISLQVTAYDVDDNVLLERTYDVPLQQNHITRCSSSYFSGASMASSIGLFNGWEGEYHLTF
ncbi:MAG: FimB/Mfa2 family fimbrial subunit [Bacteroidales bacterium]|jgi:hypothetical protein|nr:FimB/Mfa2 family fimbrial subunit [Bacteroidales bacterium]